MRKTWNVVRAVVSLAAVVASCGEVCAQANRQFIDLGPADELAVDQPRIAIELVSPSTGQVIGPDLATTFLLDTGANSILAVDDAVVELMQGGYATEGTFFEQGVAGFTEFDVSAPYHLRFAGADGVPYQIDNVRILSSTTNSFCPVPGFCSFFGIAGMPVMDGRVTTIDLSSLAGGSTLDLDNIFDFNFDVDFMRTTFGSTVPDTTLRRYSVPIRPGHFPAEADGPLPVWADLPFLEARAVQGGKGQTGDFILDTGAQLSILASDVAFAIGLDENGNGTLMDEAIGTQDIGGIGGQITAPLMLVDELRVPTAEGVDLVFSDLTVAIVDIDPSIDGIFGMNLLSSGWLGSLFGDLSGLGDLFDDAGLGDLGLGDLGGDLGLGDLGLGDLGLGDLGLGDLGIGGLLGNSGAAQPLFEKVHFDFRQMSQGQARMILDLMPQVGDVQFAGLHGDLDHDGDIDFDDRRIWVEEVERTYFGDANLDGQFDTKDLVRVFQAGEYEDDLVGNSTWETGDWNGDGDFTTRDLVIALQYGGFGAGPRPAAATVPEPSGLVLIALAAIAMVRRKDR